MPAARRVNARDFQDRHRALLDDRDRYEAEVRATVASVFAARRAAVNGRLAQVRRSLAGDVPVRAPHVDGDPALPSTGATAIEGDDDPTAVLITGSELGLDTIDADLAVALGPVLARQYRRAGRHLVGGRWQSEQADALADRQVSRLRYVGQAAAAVAAGTLYESFQDQARWSDLVAGIGKVFDRLEGGLSRSVGRLEANTVLNGASTVAASESVDGQMVRRWITQEDERVRQWHAEAHGQEVGLDEPFDVGGEALMFPGDPDGSDDNVYNCFPGDALVLSRPGIIGAYRRWYDGPLVRVTTKRGCVLAGTPNHPVATPVGWVRLGDLSQGDHTLGDPDWVERVARRDPDVADGVSSIGDLFDALDAAGPLRLRVPRLLVDFHGETPDYDVDRVGTYRDLVAGWFSSADDGIDDSRLGCADGVPVGPCGAASADGLDAVALPASCLVGGGDERRSVGGTRVPMPDDQGIATSAARDRGVGEVTSDDPAADAVATCERLLGLPAGVAVDEVVAVEVVSFAGHVYNLETLDGAYVTNGIVAHNCRCMVEYAVGDVPVDGPVDMPSVSDVEAGLAGLAG